MNMVSIYDFFGNFLKVQDIKGDIEVEVEKVEVRKVGREDDAENKPVVMFKGLDKGLALNAVNASALAEIAGDDYTAWAGVKCVLYVDPNVMYGGKRVGGVRIKKVEVKGK